MTAKILSYLAGAGLIVWAVMIVLGWRDASEALPKVEKEFADYRTQIAIDLELARSASKGYQDELAKLRETRAAAPRRIVRLCPPADPVRGTEPASGLDGAAPATIVVPDADGQGDRQGPDIAADLYAIADRADEIVAQCRGLQALASPPQ